MTPEERLQQQLQELIAGSPFHDEANTPAAVAQPPVQPVQPTPPSPAPWGPEPEMVRPASLAQRMARPPRPVPTAAEPPKEFFPPAPTSPEEIGLSASEIEALFLKFLMNRGLASGTEIAAQLCLPLGLIGGLLRQAKTDQLVVYKSAAANTDYVYELTELGSNRAHRYSRQCAYFGAAPVTLENYIRSVRAQSVTFQKPRVADLHRALSDLILSPEVFSQLGQAVRSGLGLFLHGSPGNGKTSIAERITGSFGRCVWIPQVISVAGEIIRIYDPSNHVLAPLDEEEARPHPRVDARWVRIRRPTIIAGGELTMANLEITTEAATRINEAPLQMKANCGVLVIDDFGRQRISPAELLNRWIVPLEKRYDLLNLPNGYKIQVPFDQLIVFSTNLEPRDLVDEAFLRRIPYKIDVTNPTEEEFRRLFLTLAQSMQLSCSPDEVDYLVQKHYTSQGRSMRFCHPRDLLKQIAIFCEFHELPPAVTNRAIDAATKNYFAIL